MRKKSYRVAVVVTPDRLSGDGYVATVTGGHPNINHLFAFGPDRNATLRALARTVAVKLQHSRFGLHRIAAIEMIVADQVSFTLDALDIGGKDGDAS